MDGEVHFHVCGRPSDDCEKKSNNSEACLTTGSQSATAQQRDKVIYNGQEVTITYDDVVLILYCGENGNSNTPQYIGQVKAVKAFWLRISWLFIKLPSFQVN